MLIFQLCVQMICKLITFYEQTMMNRFVLSGALRALLLRLLIVCTSLRPGHVTFDFIVQL